MYFDTDVQSSQHECDVLVLETVTEVAVAPARAAHLGVAHEPGPQVLLEQHSAACGA